MYKFICTLGSLKVTNIYILQFKFMPYTMRTTVKPKHSQEPNIVCNKLLLSISVFIIYNVAA